MAWGYPGLSIGVLRSLGEWLMTWLFWFVGVWSPSSEVARESGGRLVSDDRLGRSVGGRGGRSI